MKEQALARAIMILDRANEDIPDFRARVSIGGDLRKPANTRLRLIFEIDEEKAEKILQGWIYSL